MLLSATDGLVRDIAGRSRGYGISDVTREALELIFDILERATPKRVSRTDIWLELRTNSGDITGEAGIREDIFKQFRP